MRLPRSSRVAPRSRFTSTVRTPASAFGSGNAGRSASGRLTEVGSDSTTPANPRVEIDA
jgi:hypothetical protein